jgi:hypothetical protein
VPAVQDDKEDQILSPASFFGSVSWLDSKPAQTPRADSFSTNWLKGAPAPEESLDTARSSASANWLQAPGGTLDAKESNVSDWVHTQTAAQTNHHRPQKYNGQGVGHAKHKGSLPPLPLTLPPLPPTPPSAESKSSVRGRSSSNLPHPDTSAAAARDWLKAITPPMASDEGGSRVSGTSTPVTPEEDVDNDRAASVGRMELVASKSKKLHANRSLRLNGKKGGQDVRNLRPGNPSQVIAPSPRRSSSSCRPPDASVLEPTPVQLLPHINGHATSKKHDEETSSRDVSPFRKSPTSPAGATQHGVEEIRANAESSRRMECGRKMEMLPPEGLQIREHLNDYRFVCGVVPDTSRSALQEACYTAYFSKWKRAFVCSVIIVHSALAFVELHTTSYSRRAKPGTWRPAEQWLQALHFLFSLVYIIDAVVMTVGLTPANLNPRLRARNSSFLLLVFCITTDTLLTAMNVITSSFSLPLRLLLLVFQVPGSLRMLCFWAQIIHRSVPMLLCTFGVVVCLAAIAVTGVRETCPNRRCPQNDFECSSGERRTEVTWRYCAECEFVVPGVLTRAKPYLKTYRVCAEWRVGCGDRWPCTH